MLNASSTPHAEFIIAYLRRLKLLSGEEEENEEEARGEN